MNELIIQNNELKSKVEGIIAFYKIDPVLFNERLRERIMFSSVNEIEHKENYLLTIIRKMIQDEGLANTLKEEYQYSILDLYRTLREEGFNVDSNDMLEVENRLLYIKNNRLLNAKDTNIWVNKAISYLRENDKKNTKELLKLFYHTKTMKEILCKKIN